VSRCPGFRLLRLRAHVYCQQQGSARQRDCPADPHDINSLPHGPAGGAGRPAFSDHKDLVTGQAVAKPKKEDIDEITDHFNINAGNPVQCLTQARSTVGRTAVHPW